MGDLAIVATAAAVGTNSGPLAPSGMAADVVLLVHCTALTGTGPTLNVSLEESVDGASWTAVANSGITQLTAAGHAMSNSRPTKSYVRVLSVIGGTGPAATYRASVMVIPE